jgi:hypothetical protein
MDVSVITYGKVGDEMIRGTRFFIPSLLARVQACLCCDGPKFHKEFQAVDS